MRPSGLGLGEGYCLKPGKIQPFHLHLTVQYPIKKCFILTFSESMIHPRSFLY